MACAAFPRRGLMVVLIRALSIVVLGVVLPPAQQRGVVTGISLNPNPVAAGTPVSATATATNPCGAVFIDWGDGTKITYPISSVPATETHAYTAAEIGRASCRERV